MDKEIIDEIKKIISEINELKQEIFSLKQDIKKLTQVCSRMDEHISFVNKTYNVMKKPLDAIIGVVNRSIFYETDTLLPQIEH